MPGLTLSTHVPRVLTHDVSQVQEGRQRWRHHHRGGRPAVRCRLRGRRREGLAVLGTLLHLREYIYCTYLLNISIYLHYLPPATVCEPARVRLDEVGGRERLRGGDQLEVRHHVRTPHRTDHMIQDGCSCSCNKQFAI